MKHWWVKVYTLPALKRYSLPLLTWGMANFLNSWLFPQIRELCFIVAIYPIFVFFNNTDDLITSNLSFHQQHLKLSELRKIVFLDLFIQISFFLFLFFFFATFPWRENSSQIFIFDMLGTTSVLVLWITIGLLSLIVTRLGIAKKKQIELSSIDPASVDHFSVILIVLILLSFMFYLFLMSISPYLMVYFFISAIVLKLIVMWYLDSFHFFVKRKKISTFIVLGLLAIELSLIHLMSNTAKKEIYSSTFTLEQRIQTFAFFRNFNVSLNPKVVSELLGSPFANEILYEIFNYSDESVFLVDVDQVIIHPDYKVYAAYIKTGKVTEHNFQMILNRLKKDKQEWSHSEYYSTFKKNLLHFYPQAKDFSDRSVAGER